MNILLLGSGGREHALAWKIAASPLADKLYCAPGNAGIAQEAECVGARYRRPRGGDRVLQGASKIDFVVVGPEAPLCAGIVDDLEAAGIKAFGPSKWAARLEGSKGFTKDLCKANDIPTAAYERFNERGSGEGLCAREGRADRGQGRRACRRQGRRGRETRRGGRSRDRHDVRRRLRRSRRREIVIEEFLDGEEASFFALCDGETAIAARLGAGPQARRRRRQGSEHRRHGRLFAGAGR